MDVITEGKKIQNELVELRRYFHEHPELPWEEFNTQKKIMEYLDELGIPYQESSKTGVIATIKGPHSSDKILGFVQISMHCRLQSRQRVSGSLRMKARCMHAVMIHISPCSSEQPSF